jgi:hypothetical protein
MVQYPILTIFFVVAIALPAAGWCGDWPQSGNMASKGTAKAYTEGNSVTIDGILFSAIADPSITIDGKPHSYPAIKLNTPLNFICKIVDDFCHPELNVSLLQLVLNNSMMESFKKHKGSVVRVEGSLFYSGTGHHFTPVLITVTGIIAR